MHDTEIFVMETGNAIDLVYIYIYIYIYVCVCVCVYVNAT